MTLIELIVVISIIALISGVAALAMPRRTVPADDTTHRIAKIRAKALLTGQSATVVIRLASAYSIATALPDGTVLADSAAHVDRLTGRVNAPRDFVAHVGATP
ncbi:MAG: type II secretion system protein [Gemmatimonadaceae bacterium]